ncbi:hypothetical protein MTO96_043239 [Rhipicephalus appendiculatus]
MSSPNAKGTEEARDGPALASAAANERGPSGAAGGPPSAQGQPAKSVAVRPGQPGTAGNPGAASKLPRSTLNTLVQLFG